MPRISPTEFYALSLRVHTFLDGIPLHDVWAVDLPAHRDGITLSELLRRESQSGINILPPAARALFRLRFVLGRVFRLDAEPKDASAESFVGRLTLEDRARSFVVPGTPEGLFRVVYRFENEQLLEIQNRTVHGAALSALAKRADSYRFYFAVYVRQRTWITPLYMGLIDPFRRWIIYPALLKKIRATWDQNIRPNDYGPCSNRNTPGD
ncbi:MAG TPA: DUF2867 domain-containing protein [Terriglobia bacterium]|nr:DUF2867 domain-containing protein [Terriglobia bacterium]